MNTKTYTDYQGLIIEWARERGLLDGDPSVASQKQLLKTLSEIGELADGLVKNDLALIKDAIGDVAVTLVIFCELCDYKLMLDGLDGWPLRHTIVAHYLNSLLMDYVTMSMSRPGSDSAPKAAMTAFLSLKQIAAIHNLTLLECLAHAWEEIKDRKGKTVGGVFIKSVVEVSDE